jgi:hypothetical protein
VARSAGCRAAPAREAPGETDSWVVLFTSHGAWRAAGASYRRRWAAEGSYRDAQSGWDGRHGWDLEGVAARLPSAARVGQVVGRWALATALQTWVGHQVGLPTAPAPVQAVARQWTTTGRLSVWARGRRARTEPSGRVRAWLRTTLAAGAETLATAPLPRADSAAASAAARPTPAAAPKGGLTPAVPRLEIRHFLARVAAVPPGAPRSR